MKRLIVILLSVLIVSLPAAALMAQDSNTDNSQEFIDLDSAADTVKSSEFISTDSSATGVFSEFSQDKSSEAQVFPNQLQVALIVALLMTIAAGIYVKFKTTRYLRGVFLAVSVAYFGFYLGGCPCVIESFQNGVLAFFSDIPWWKYILFVGIIPLTVLLGRVWCGWVCHLGALQELLFFKDLKILHSPKAQKILRTVQIIATVALVVQLIIVKRIVIDLACPFKVIYNLFSSNVTGYVLAGLLVVSSIFIYRPFCRTICPVGLILSTAQALPFSRKIKPKSCTSCGRCTKTCKTGGVAMDGKEIKFYPQNCFFCGDCLDKCHKTKS